MVNMNKRKKISKRKFRQRKKKYLIFCLSFLLIEIVLISFFIYAFRDNRIVTDADVYSIKTKIVQTSTSGSGENLYLTTTNGKFITSGQYMKSHKYCKEVASLLLDDSEIELKVLKNSDYFSMHFTDQASVVVEIKSATTVYLTMEQYNDYCEANLFNAVLSFIIFEVIVVAIGVYIIVIVKRIYN